MSSSNPNAHQNDHDAAATRITCDVLCSLGSAAPPSADAGATINGGCGMTYNDPSSAASSIASSPCTKGGKSPALSACPKQHQLPMFLSKTYHMIDRCEPNIATWSMDGSNFVVKNVEKFASGVLPLYFKHSNFSSFARQLNFYGFRKLRTDPILTSDVDPRTACYVRFYHEKFQKDRPELLHQIKRATKSDQQSKDDVESLKGEVNKLKEALGQLRDDTDRRLAEMSYESNRRITSMGAEYDKLAAVVQQLLAASNPAAAAAAAPQLAPSAATSAAAPHALAHVPGSLHPSPHAAAIAAAAAVAAGSTAPPLSVPMAPVPAAAAPNGAPTPAATAAAAAQQARMPDLMQSLSHAASISLQQQQHRAPAPPAAATAVPATAAAPPAASNGAKRPAEGEAVGAPPAKQPPLSAPQPAEAQPQPQQQEQV